MNDDLMSRMFVVSWMALAAVFYLGGFPLSVQAQDQDPPAAPADTVETETGAPDDDLTIEDQPPLDFVVDRGRDALSRLPAFEIERDLAAMLGAQPDGFLYDLGAAGWPDGWSWRGWSPNAPSLYLEGHPHNDPVTDRPRFDLLPAEFLRNPKLASDRSGGAVGVLTRFRPYDVIRPYTEIRYRRDADHSMQSVGVVHAQQREIGFRDQPGLLQIVGGFYGRGSDGEFPNSDLRRERRILGRLLYRQEGWSVELTNLSSRRRLGAHTGLVQQEPFNRVFNRAIPQNVEESDARRQTIRNDLTLTTRFPLTPGTDDPLLTSGRWTSQTFQFRNGGSDTLRVRSNSIHLLAQQNLTYGRHHLELEVGGTFDGQPETEALSDSLRSVTSRTRLRALARDSLRIGPVSASLEGGVHLDDTRVFPSFSARFSHDRDGWSVFAEGELSGQPVSWIEQHGFGNTVEPLGDVPNGQSLQGALGINATWRTVDIGLTGFGHIANDPVDLFITDPDDRTIAAARTLDDAYQRVGATLTLGWRRDASTGLYAHGQATTVQMLNADASPEHSRVDDALPEAFGEGRIGARFELFDEDLDIDLYLRGRAWTAVRSRAFHGPTALFAVPVADGFRIQPDGTIDAIFESVIRDTATLTLGFDNVLSGTQVQPGAMVVPIFPLPEQQFRIGVHWPLWD